MSALVIMSAAGGIPQPPQASEAAFSARRRQVRSVAPGSLVSQRRVVTVLFASATALRS